MSNTKLNQKWTLWYDDFRDENSPKDYDKNLYIISSFDNIENFWGTYNNVPKVCNLPVLSSYHLMKFKIKPLWEDQQNYQGSVTKYTFSSVLKDDFWKEALIFVISLQFAHQYDYDMLNGISIINKDGQAVFKVWSNNQNESTDFMNSLEQQIQIYLPSISIQKINSQKCIDLVRKLKQSKQ